jgi:hypothetical protein
MDAMGDADELGRGDELGHGDELPHRRRPVLTAEALAVTSLATAVTSLFVTGVSQFITFLLQNTLSLNNQDNEQRQFSIVMAPVVALSLTAVVCGVAALKRRSDDRWVGALAVAGTTVGAVIVVLVAATFVAVWIIDPSSSIVD